MEWLIRSKAHQTTLNNCNKALMKSWPNAKMSKIQTGKMHLPHFIARLCLFLICRCESGAKIMDCLMEGAIKRGIRGAFYGPNKS